VKPILLFVRRDTPQEELDDANAIEDEKLR